MKERKKKPEFWKENRKKNSIKKNRHLKKFRFLKKMLIF